MNTYGRYIFFGLVLLLLTAVFVVPAFRSESHNYRRQAFRSIIEQNQQQDEVYVLIGQAQLLDDEMLIDSALEAISQRVEQPFESDEERLRMRFVQVNFFNDMAARRGDLGLLESAFEIEHNFDSLRNPEVVISDMARANHIARLGRLYSTQAQITSDPDAFQQADSLLTEAIEQIGARTLRLRAKDLIWDRASVLSDWGKLTDNVDLLERSTADYRFYRDASNDVGAGSLARHAQIEISWNKLAVSEITGDYTTLPDVLRDLEATLQTALPYLLDPEKERIRPASDALLAAIESHSGN